MKHQYTKSRFFYLFLSIYACTTTCAAQSLHAAATHYAIYQKEGQIIISDGKAEENISNGTNDTLPFLTGNEIYYVSNPAKNNNAATGGTIVVYNINDKSKTDVLKTIAQNEDYTFRDVIVNMQFDKVSGRLYFSTVAKNRKQDFITWVYDMNSKKLSSYKDGLLIDIDQHGNQTVVFYGHDYKGNYVKKNIYSKDGTIFESFDKEYSTNQLK